MSASRFRPLLALLVLLALVAAACGGDGGDGGSNTSGGGGNGGNGDGGDDLPECPLEALESWDAGADGRVEVVLWHTLVAETRDTLVAMAEDYNASQDKVTVRVESQGQSYDELLRKYTQAIPTGDLPGLVALEDTVTQFIADSGTILPGQSCFEASGVSLDDFMPLAVDYYTVDGVFQPVSLSLSTIILYYNREHFTRAGLDPDAPPRTLGELRAAAEALQSAGVTQQPLVMNMQPWFIEHLLTGAGAPIVDDDNGRGEVGATASAFDNDAATEVFTWLAGMQADGLLNAVPGTEGQFDHYFAVALEQASMTFETSTAVTSINAFLEGNLDPAQFDLDLEELPPVDLDIGVGVYPGVTDDAAGRGQLGGGVWYIPNTSPPEVQAAAWDFARWFNDPAQQVRWHLEGSYLPWNLAAAEDPAVTESWATTRKGGWLQIAYDALTNADPAWPGPLIGPYDDTRDAIRDGLDELLFVGAEPADAVAQADAAINEAVERYNDENF